MKRSSGILLPMTSLPSSYGIGTLGKEAFRFVDFLKYAGQTYWQMLPLGPTGFGDSPYQCASSFAGNPYLIDLDLLIFEELLTNAEVKSVNFGSDPKRVDYGALYHHREPLLRKAFERHSFHLEGHPLPEDLQRFLSENAFWLDDFALFMALKTKFQMKSWQDWDDEAIRYRDSAAMALYRDALHQDIRYHMFVQYLFYKQWNTFKEYATKKGVLLIGDLPIYVPLDSVDVWSEPSKFKLDSRLIPRCVSGVPPDGFTADGQLWGSPIYEWSAHKAEGYAWWMRRIGAAAKMFEAIRIDHFRGLDSYWQVPYGEPTAVNGKWMPGPGKSFIDQIRAEFPETDFIAEDLGVLSESVTELLEYSGFPGMRVMQFAFLGNCVSAYLPHSYTKNSVVYTGTHDNNTFWGWMFEAPSDELKRAKAYLGLSRKEGWDKGFLRGGLSSVADLFVAQMQDHLELSAWARMNKPGSAAGNWRWRLESSQLTEELARSIEKMTRRYER